MMTFSIQLSAEIMVSSRKQNQNPKKKRLINTDTPKKTNNTTESFELMDTISLLINASDLGIIPLSVKYDGNIILDLLILVFVDPFEAP